jgi:hypothetical protein
MVATRLKANPGETEAAVERQELFEEEINVDTIASSEDRYGEQHLAVRRRRGAKKRSQDSVGSRQKLSVACKRVIHLAVPAVRKGQMRKSPGKELLEERRLIRDNGTTVNAKTVDWTVISRSGYVCG